MDEYPFKWITKSLAVGYAPRSVDDLQTIRASGIRAIVNLCAECYDLNKAESDFNFEVYHLPIADEAAPSLEELEILIGWMNRQIKSGNQVLVHCRYGIGRTGTVVLSFLIHSGYDFKEAQKMMKRTPSWPANRKQEELVDSFIMKLSGVSIADKFPDKSPNVVSKFFERWNIFSKWSD